MATTYSIKAKFTDSTGTDKRTINVNNANSGVTKEQVVAFGTAYATINENTQTLTEATLVSTTTTDLLID